MNHWIDEERGFIARRRNLLSWMTDSEIQLIGVRGQNVLYGHNVESFEQLCNTPLTTFEGPNVGPETIKRIAQVIVGRGALPMRFDGDTDRGESQLQNDEALNAAAKAVHAQRLRLDLVAKDSEPDGEDKAIAAAAIKTWLRVSASKMLPPASYSDFG